jgi:glycine/D-amino acid oxidase-like deaminating enzyme
MQVLIIGGGVAGTAAALAAARPGVRVTLVDGGPGASTLATGALDALPWHRAQAQPEPIASSSRKTLEALGGYLLPDSGARLLTTAGIVRQARGHDAALLDVGRLTGKRIGVVACDRPGWDAAALARAWGAHYEPVDAAILRHVDEHVLPDADFATRHDDEARLQWLADRLRETLARVGENMAAFVLPPCLGVERARAQRLSELVRVPCGEAIALPGGPSGLRFERARDRALDKAGVERASHRAISVVREGDRWRVAMRDGSAAEGDGVVVATGGLLGGGIEYAPADSVIASALPPSARQPFRLTIDAPMALGSGGIPLERPGSLFGKAPESLAWPFVRDALMDRVGVLADAEGAAAPGLFVAGDLRADRPRTWLDVLATGVAAGAAAVRTVLNAPVAESPSYGEAPPIRP